MRWALPGEAGIAAEVLCQPALAVSGGIYNAKIYLQTPTLLHGRPLWWFSVLCLRNCWKACLQISGETEGMILKDLSVTLDAVKIIDRLSFEAERGRMGDNGAFRSRKNHAAAMQ